MGNCCVHDTERTVRSESIESSEKLVRGKVAAPRHELIILTPEESLRLKNQANSEKKAIVFAYAQNFSQESDKVIDLLETLSCKNSKELSLFLVDYDLSNLTRIDDITGDVNPPLVKIYYLNEIEGYLCGFDDKRLDNLIKIVLEKIMQKDEKNEINLEFSQSTQREIGDFDEKQGNESKVNQTINKENRDENNLEEEEIKKVKRPLNVRKNPITYEKIDDKGDSFDHFHSNQENSNLNEKNLKDIKIYNDEDKHSLKIFFDKIFENAFNKVGKNGNFEKSISNGNNPEDKLLVKKFFDGLFGKVFERVNENSFSTHENNEENNGENKEIVKRFFDGIFNKVFEKVGPSTDPENENKEKVKKLFDNIFENTFNKIQLLSEPKKNPKNQEIVMRFFDGIFKRVFEKVENKTTTENKILVKTFFDNVFGRVFQKIESSPNYISKIEGNEKLVKKFFDIIFQKAFDRLDLSKTLSNNEENKIKVESFFDNVFSNVFEKVRKNSKQPDSIEQIKESQVEDIPVIENPSSNQDNNVNKLYKITNNGKYIDITSKEEFQKYVDESETSKPFIILFYSLKDESIERVSPLFDTISIENEESIIFARSNLDEVNFFKETLSNLTSLKYPVIQCYMNGKEKSDEVQGDDHSAIHDLVSYAYNVGQCKMNEKNYSLFE